MSCVARCAISMVRSSSVLRELENLDDFRMLYQELREEMPNLAHKPILLGPQELDADQTPSPVLYDIEDPWGQSRFRSEKPPLERLSSTGSSRQRQPIA